jgi:hypothetical protein
MPRQKLPVGESASLSPEQAIPILEQQIREGREFQAEDWRSPRVKRWAQTSEGALAAAFGSSHDNVRAFGREFHSGVYYPDDSEARLQKQFVNQVSEAVAVLQSAVDQLRWKLPKPDQVFLPAGSQHDAYVEIRGIVVGGVGDLMIIDPYLDQTLWPLLTNVPKTVRIRILGQTLKGDFALEARRFATQHGAAVEIRRTANYHDRFIVVDGTRCWHLGASIKDAGSKACLISEVVRPEVVKFIISDAESEWSRSTAVTV